MLYHTMVKEYPGRITAAYNISEDLDDAEVLPSIARSKNLVLSEGREDSRRAADLFLDDLRSGKLGRVSLERP